MIILFIHQKIPSQFRNIIDKLSTDINNTIYCICNEQNINLDRENINVIILNKISTDSLEFNGLLSLKAMLFLRDEKKIIPDVIVTHIGFGHDIYIKEAYPYIPLIGYFEYYYDNANVSCIARNKVLSDQMENCSLCISPTVYQRNRFPEYQSKKILTLHEGIDTEYFIPKNTVRNYKYVTYISRGNY